MMMTREEIAQIFPEMVAHFNPAKAQGVEARIQFELSGENGGSFWVRIDDGAAMLRLLLEREETDGHEGHQDVGEVSHDFSMSFPVRECTW